jgi:hypothetical protein
MRQHSLRGASGHRGLTAVTIACAALGTLFAACTSTGSGVGHRPGAIPPASTREPAAGVDDKPVSEEAVALAAAGAPEPLRNILLAHPGLRAVLADAPRYRFQAVLGVVEERPGSRPVLVQHGFRSGAEYLYPASTVKLFAAIAALEYLAELRRATGLPIDADTPLRLHPLFRGEALEETDPTHVAGGSITVRHEIRKIFLVSDNEAFNRLYELVGPDRLAASLARAGIADARIVHRLSEPRTAEENLRLPRIDFVGEGFVHTLPERTAAPLPPPADEAGLLIGEAYFAGEEKVEGPMDFAPKNRFPLAALQRGLCMVIRPDVDCGGPGFDLSPADRELLVTAMGQTPRESTDPLYDPAEHPDAEVKWILPGVRRALAADAVRVHDKTGQAYGFTLENAWVAETAGGRSFFLAAALYTNSDGVLNDDAYDYETIALPFLADLGEAAVRVLWGCGGPLGSDLGAAGECTGASPPPTRWF